MFRNVSNLTSLNMCATALTSICFLLPLVRLRTLDFSFNSLTQIDTDMEQKYCLNNFTFLEKLDMGFNMLGPYFAIPGFYDQPFTGLVNLRTLILSANNITSTQPRILDNIPSLKRLDLSANNILTLDTVAFSFSFVDFSLNEVTIVSPAVISRLTPSVRLSLAGNPFDCSCDLIPFLQWIADNKISQSTLVNLSEYTCASPLTTHGKRMLDIDSIVIVRSCFPLHWKTTAIAVVFFVIFVMAVCGNLIYRFRWPLCIRLHKICKRYKQRSSITDYEELGDYHAEYYDLMISHFPNDESGIWVKEVLLPAIDRRERTRRRTNVNNPRTALSEADDFVLFMAEHDLGNNEVSIGPVIEAMQRARKVMLVVTEGYLKGGKCRFEMDSAVFKSESDNHGNDEVIVVLFDKSIHVRLLKLLHGNLKLHEALRWTPNDENGKHLFWQQLKDRLTRDQLC